MSSTSIASINALLSTGGRVFSVPGVGIFKQEIGKPLALIKALGVYTLVNKSVYTRKIS